MQRVSDEYWRETDRNRRNPQEFVDTLTAARRVTVTTMTPLPAGTATQGEL